MKKEICCALAILVTGCASNSGVVRTGPDTFMVSRQAATGFSGSGTLKAEAVREANEYCLSQKKKLQVVNTAEAQPPYILGNFPKAEVQFMCLDANDSELARPKLSKEQRDDLAFLDERLKTLTNQLLADFTGSSDIRIAVLPIENASGGISGPLGNYLTERLTNSLYAKSVGKLVERSQLKKVIDELALTQGGIFDEGSAKKIGRFLGVDAVVTGTYAELGNQTIEVNSRMVRVETGEVLGAGSIQIPSSAVLQLLRQNNLR